MKPPKTVRLKGYNGLNNRVRDTALPVSRETGLTKVRNAVNCDFDDAGQIIFPRVGKILEYAGNIQWAKRSPFVTVFIEDGHLKRLNPDRTATLLWPDFGAYPANAVQAHETLYISNGYNRCKVSATGQCSPWGVEVPPRQPDCAAVDHGDLFAGEYRVAITWIADEESGTGNSVRLTVPAGGGIHVTNFPTPPTYVEAVAVWVSSVDSEELYLYDEYPATIDDVTITSVETSPRQEESVPLSTQFGYPPEPGTILCAHYGRIYYAIGNNVFWTDMQRYGLQFMDSYWPFESEVQIIVSRPNVLYIGTEQNVYRITDIDGDGPANIVAMDNVGAVRGTEVYDPDGESAYFVTERGFVRATADGLTELSYADVALPFFEAGAMTVIEREGTKYLIGVFRGGTQNPLADRDYVASEAARNTL